MAGWVIASGTRLLRSEEVEDGCESDVGKNHEERGFYDCCRCGTADIVRSTSHMKSLETADLYDYGGECEAFQQARHDIAQYDCIGDIPQVQTERHLGTEAHKQAAGENSTGVAQNSQARKRDQHLQIFGGEQELDR